MDEEDVVYIHNGIVLSHEKEKKVMPFAATWIQLEILILSELRKRQIPCDSPYMWNLKYGTDEPVYKAEGDS